jgi:Ca-activated chloride channel homolog
MNALVTSAPLGAAFLALVVAAIVGLHLWRPRPLRRVVASTLLWERAALRAGIRTEPWRWWLALALALAIGVLCVVVLTRPEVQGFGDGARRTLVVVENGPSLATRSRDGRSRWQHARAVARDVILAAPGPVMVLDSTGSAPAAGFVARDEALAALESLVPTSIDEATFPDVPGDREVDVHVVGDGVAGIVLPPGATVHSVFEPADNVAVLRLAVRPSPADPLQVEAFVQVFNASPARRSVRLTLRGGARFSVVQTLAMAPGELVDATFDVSGFEGGVLAAAAHIPSDALPQDDIAYAVVDAHRTKRVMLVTRGNAALADSLAALPGVRVEVVAPSRYRGQSGIDAFVFDGFAPAQPPTAGALLFRPPDVSWLPRAANAPAAVSVDRWDRSAGRSSGVAWNAVTVRRASQWKTLPAGVTELAGSAAGSLVVAGRTGVPWIATGFLSGDTDLPLQPAFPIFLGHALTQITEGDAVQGAPLGVVRVPLADAEVRDGKGNVIATRAIPGGTLFDAVRPDIYTARAPGGVVRIAAAVLDPRLADVNRSRFGSTSAFAGLGAGLPFERWGLLVFAVVVLLLLDWVAFTRRITR